MMKRLTSILLTLAMLVGLLPALSPQAEAPADDATALLQEVSTKTSVPSGYTPIYRCGRPAKHAGGFDRKLYPDERY